MPPEVLSVLLEFLKDDTILIFENKKTSVGGTGQETNTGKANVKEVGKGDGRVMAVQALMQIGPGRVRARADVTTQLQALANNPMANADLRDRCKELLKTLK